MNNERIAPKAWALLPVGVFLVLGGLFYLAALAVSSLVFMLPGAKVGKQASFQ